jgi:DNA gyrase/topoisomerase IV subunit A
VNKAAMVEKIAELVREKRIDGIADIRDESDRQGMRVVIELKRDTVADVVLNQLYRFSPLQTSFGCNMVALIGGKPEQLTLKDMIRAFTEFREEVIGRRIKFLLRKARDRAHVLVGLAIAVANIDEVIAVIRKAPDPATAREQLMARDWPAGDVVALVELIADPRHKVSAKAHPDDRSMAIDHRDALRVADDRKILDAGAGHLYGLQRIERRNRAEHIPKAPHFRHQRQLLLGRVDDRVYRVVAGGHERSSLNRRATRRAERFRPRTRR